MLKTALSLGAAITLVALPLATRAQHAGHDGHGHELTPEKSGEVRYACGMDMITGVLLVR